MKTTRIVLALVVTLAAALASETAFAHGPRGPRLSIGIGFGFGVPFAAFPYYYPPYRPYYYYPPYRPYYYQPVYYPAPVVVQQQPTVYIEQAAPQVQQQPAAGYWYYCADSRAYYPYVKDCPAGWQRVAPQPGN